MFLCVGLLARVSGNSQGLSRNDGYCESIVLVPRTVNVPSPCYLSFLVAFNQRLGPMQLHSQPHHTWWFTRGPTCPKLAYAHTLLSALRSQGSSEIQFTINKHVSLPRFPLYSKGPEPAWMPSMFQWIRTLSGYPPYSYGLGLYIDAFHGPAEESPVQAHMPRV